MPTVQPPWRGYGPRRLLASPTPWRFLTTRCQGSTASHWPRPSRPIPVLAPIRLVMLSAVSQRGQGTTAQQAGITAFLTKPVRQSHLYTCLMTIMGAAGPTVIPPITDRQAATPLQIHARVLVVEDNVVNQKVAVRLIEKLGCRVDVAANGREAVNLLAQVAYHVVLMDCQMPEMDGFAATAAIRRREASTGHHVPIIALTANAMQGDRERCLAAGMDGYLAKPIKRGRALLRPSPNSGPRVRHHRRIRCPHLLTSQRR